MVRRPMQLALLCGVIVSDGLLEPRRRHFSSSQSSARMLRRTPSKFDGGLRRVLLMSSSGEDCATKEACDLEVLTLEREAEKLSLRAEKLRLEATLDELALAKERLEALRMKDSENQLDATMAEAAEQIAAALQKNPGPPPIIIIDNTTKADDEDDDDGFDMAAIEKALEKLNGSGVKYEIINSKEDDVAEANRAGMREMDLNEALEFMFPGAVPIEKMTPEKAGKIREAICDLKSFSSDSIDVCDRGIVMRGTTRTTDLSTALRRCEANLAKSVYASELRLFLIEDPLPIDPEAFEARVNDAQMRLAAGDEEAQNPFELTKRPPVLVAVAKGTRPQAPAPAVAAAVRLASGAATSFSILAYSVSTGALNEKLYDPLSNGDPAALAAVLPVGAFVIAIGIAHEIAHSYMASQRNVSWSAPLFALPCLSTGTLGGVNYLEDFAPNRKALFDVSIAGPIVGLSLGMVAMFAGALITSQASPEALAELPRLPLGALRSSALGSFLTCAGSPGSATTILGSIPADAAPLLLPMHPLGLAGLVAILTNALQLLPLGRTDGARCLLAIIGRPLAQSFSALALLVTSIVGVAAPNDLLLFHLLFVFALQRDPEAPCLEELSPIGETRKNMYTIAFGVALFALLPAPFAAVSPMFGDGSLMPSGFPSL